MQFSKLRLTGFKSFVEPTEFEIEPGLTGVIGPNGCGKSNLVEALRWVMGENSYRSMRASGMDDVIFAGGGDRPARNMAEVGLTLDNATRSAPAAFNDADVLEVTRRIERGAGSTYRINAREVRARDVQILFADASTGARSPAMVRQGQISEIIAAKPQARRRILEEAAGVAGLHTRRHEAELRLKGAEDNLGRIDDVLAQITSQGESLRRQARQAQRYKLVQAEIRRTQALAALLDWEDARREHGAALSAMALANAAVIETTRAQGEAARHQAVAAHALPSLRAEEAEASAALQKIMVARETLEAEERRAKSRRSEIDRRIGEMEADVARDLAALEDAALMSARLDAEASDLAGRDHSETEEAALAMRIAETEAGRVERDAVLAEAERTRAEAAARRRAVAERGAEIEQRFARTARSLAEAERAGASLRASLDPGDGLAGVALLQQQANEALAASDRDAVEAERALVRAREVDMAARAPLAEADRAVQRLDTEVRTLAKLLATGAGGRWPSVVETLEVERGYEAALGAALGDDLEASADTRAPAHWADSDGGTDPALPAGVVPLAHRVVGPPALRRRLAQIGLVDRAEGETVRRALQPGQRLVSREGDLWRWDGFTQAAEAPTAAARRLVERNRLVILRAEAERARATYEGARRIAEAAQSSLREIMTRDAAARTAAQAARRAHESARDSHVALERRVAEGRTRLAGADAAIVAARGAHDEAAAAKTGSEAVLAALPAADDPARIATLRAEIAALRATETEMRVAFQAIGREREARTRRLAAIDGERRSWTERLTQAMSHRADVEARLEEARRERRRLADAPDHFVAARRRLLSGIEEAEAALRGASDARVAGETRLAETDRAARGALDAMTAARVAKARDEGRSEAATQRLEASERSIAADLDCAPAALPILAGTEADAERPAAAVVAARLESLKADRDRLGAVNLRADEELAEIEARSDGLAKEKADLAEAIRRLRQAIASLNREGRERLLGAFDKVNAHFGELFKSLFQGGEAELQLVESDDPLEAGLEIMANPPGKKPQVMSLLSGGEQALTAISLIFAVFLTNPSPICVLDEVDAPLDDANVERFCDLVDAMRGKTDTRFIAITHNPITMARMDRLYGVTQAERGISQLVSVDLAEAEEMLEAS